jgi:hypothetical protein
MAARTSSPLLPDQGLADQLRRGFLFGGAWTPWGTLLVELARQHALTITGDRRLLLPSNHLPLAGLPVVGAEVHAPASDRPVMIVCFGLEEALQLTEPAGVNQATATLCSALGPALETSRPDARGSAYNVTHTSRWDLGPVAVSLSAYGAVRSEAGRRLSGSLWLHADEELLAAPFLTGLVEPAATWHAPTGTISSLAVPDLVSGSNTDGHLALYRRDLRLGPAWAVAALGPHTVGLWTHPSGWSGLCDGRTSAVFRTGDLVGFTLERSHPARGPGAATLSWAGGSILHAAPGADGLDQVAARLAQHRGCTVHVVETEDC